MKAPGELIRRIPEFASPHSVKLAPDSAVPLTDRIINLIDSKTFQKLRGIRQLSLADRVFPSATHTRFSHALGVYKNILDYLRALDKFAVFRRNFTEEDYLAVMLAGLLHDLGHYPCAHQLDHLPSFPEHEPLTVALVNGDLKFAGEDLSAMIRDSFGIDPKRITSLLESGSDLPPHLRLLRQLIDSPIDADKCDYLPRDSYFCGVDYGVGFDRERFIRNLVPSEDGVRLCIHEKGLMSAERFQLARYWMYRSVYWGHTVRAFITMLSEACRYLPPVEPSPEWRLRLLSFNDGDFMAWLREQATHPGTELIDMLHNNRQPYKRVFTVSFHRNSDVYDRLQDENTRLHISGEVRRWTSKRGLKLAPHHLIWDVPPTYKNNNWETFPIKNAAGDEFPIDQESPVIDALSRAFLQGVRQIRLFGHPDLVALIGHKGRKLPMIEEML